jgi:DNA-binding response OmpR family regulator
MSSSRTVLVIDRARGSLSGVMEELDDLGFRVVWVPSLAAALEFVEAGPDLALIIASSTATRVGGVDFLTKVRKLAPGVRIIWGRSRDEETRSVSTGPSQVADSMIPEPFGPDELRSAISQLLFGHFYPPAVAEAIKTAALEVLGPLGDFHVDGEAFLVANRLALDEVSAVIQFAGGAAGHLTVSMTREQAAKLYGLFVRGARPAHVDHLEDLIGELCNQVLGRINSFFVQRGVSIHHGTPIFIRAAGSIMRYPGSRPSFAVTLVGADTRLYLEYYLSDFDRENIEGPVMTRTLSLGEIRYL